MTSPAARSKTGAHLRMFGMDISIPLSGIVGVILIAWLWAPNFGTGGSGLPAAAVFAVGLYLCVLAHELAHGLMARATGNHVHGITLWILGGYTVYERERLTPGREFIIAGSGPAVTLALAGVCWGAAGGAAATELPQVVVAILQALAVTNLLLGIVNLLPGLPLDGGGLVRAIVWAITGNEYRGTMVAGWVGRLLGLLIGFVPLGLALVPGANISLVTAVLGAVFGAFIWFGATQSIRMAKVESRLPKLSAATMARRAVPIGAEDSVAVAMSKIAQGQAGAGVVMRVDQPVGIISDAAIAAVPLERQAWVPARSVASTLTSETVVDYRLTGRDLISALQQMRANEVLVCDEHGSIYGVLFISDIEAAINN